VWGYEDPNSEGSKAEERVDRDIAKAMNLDVISTEIISEGGNREFNGKGVMLTVKSVETQRNPEKTLEELEAQYKRVLGVTKIIWLERGLYEDDLTFEGPLPGPTGKKEAYTVITTGGHIDEFCRFVSPDTILLAEVTAEEAAHDPIASENRKRLEENYDILKHATDQDGNTFKIIRMHLPYVIYDYLQPGDGVYDYISELEYQNGHKFPKGEKVMVIAASSYHNFLVTNGVVLAQKYWKPGMPGIIKKRDQESMAILQNVFPDRKIVPLDPMAVNIGGGGIHCITQQEPATE
jgi:agmatine deiminase